MRTYLKAVQFSYILLLLLVYNNVSAEFLCYAGQSYDSDGLLIHREFSSAQKPILQCHQNCKCQSSVCLNRVVRQQSYAKLETFSTDRKGLGVKSLAPVARGQFICEYLGEVLDATEAQKRLSYQLEESGNYLLTVREHYHSSSPQVVAIDARHYGNISRYINHSCEPNLAGIIVKIGNDLPRLGFFAKNDIKTGDELCYNYGNEQSLLSVTKCQCGSDSCRGFLPLDVL